MGKRSLGKTLFNDEGMADAIDQQVDQSVKRVQAIAAAYMDESLDPSQYEQALKSLNYAVESLDEAQAKIEDDISGRDDLAQIMDESSQASVLMHNIATTRMAATTCARSIQSDMEENMTLEDALEVPANEIDDTNVVPSPEQALKNEDAVSTAGADATVVDDVAPQAVVDPVIEPTVAAPSEENPIGTSENEDGTTPASVEENPAELAPPEEPIDPVVSTSSHGGSLKANPNLAAKVRIAILS